MKIVNMTQIPPLLEMSVLLTLIPVCRSQVYNLIKDGLFMTPIPLTTRRKVWITTEVQTWIEAKMAGSNNEQIKALVVQLQNKRHQDGE